MSGLKIAASTYLNSAPLVYGLQHRQIAGEYQFLGDTAPARCADMLMTKQVDAALIPSIEYQRIPNIVIVPDIAIAAKKEVRSVVLIARVPIDQIESVALDTSSRTSATLVRIILEKFYRLSPQYAQFTPDLPQMLERHDSALIIGDPAILAANEAAKFGYQVYDLAIEWRKATGLPFVFAVWAVSQKMAQNREISKIFLEAKQLGLSARNDIAQYYSETLSLSVQFLLQYITENINYDLDEENLAGLHQFYQLSNELKLISQLKQIQFIEQHIPI